MMVVAMIRLDVGAYVLGHVLGRDVLGRDVLSGMCCPGVGFVVWALCLSNASSAKHVVKRISRPNIFEFEWRRFEGRHVVAA